MTAPNRLAVMLRLLRIAESKSLRDLASEIGVAPATVQRVEQGKAMDLETWLSVQAWLLGRGVLERAATAGLSQDLTDQVEMPAEPGSEKVA